MYYQKVRGLRTKPDKLWQTTLQCNYVIIILSETLLNDYFFDRELLNENFTVYRRDKTIDTSCKKMGGDVLIAVKLYSSAPIEKIRINVEGLWISVMFGNVRYIFCVVYVPRLSKSNLYDEYIVSLEKLLLLLSELCNLCYRGP